MKKYLSALAALSLVGALYGCDNESDSCVDDFDCKEGFDCVNKICVAQGATECIVDGECGIYSCDTQAGVCNSSCTSNDQCASGAECNDSGFCQITGGNHTYSSILLVSRTPDDDDEGSCRSPNPGPDIDYVELISAGTPIAPTSVTGAHGGFCGSEQMGTPENPWAEPDVALERLSIPDVIPGECNIQGTENLYFFMGLGQAYEAGETIAEGTGFLNFKFPNTFADGDQIKVYEVNGDDGEMETCTNINRTRGNDIYGAYLVSDQVTEPIGVNTKLDAPNFISLGDKIGIGVFTIALD